MSASFLAMALLLAAAFALGGSTNSEVATLILLRPLAALLLGFGLWRLRRGHLAGHGLLVGLALATVGLAVVQLVPLPYAVWSRLPGREAIQAVDAAAGLGRIARPLSMAPEATRDALASLLIPLAALVLGLGLDARERIRLLPLLLILAGASACVGFLQVLAAPEAFLNFYDEANAGQTVGLFANRNHQALLLAMLLPALALWGAGLGPASGVRALAVFLMALLLLPLILITGSRAGLIAGIVALLSVPFLITDVRRLSLRPGSVTLAGWRIPPGAARAAALVAVVGAVALTIWLGRAVAWERLLASSAEDEGRIRILPDVLRILRLYLPWGSGLGSFDAVFELHEPDGLLAPNYMNHAHNDWLEVVLTGGAPGAGMLLVALAAFGRGVVRCFVGSPGRAPGIGLARLGLILLLLAALGSLSDYPLRTPALAAVLVVAALWTHSPQSAASAPPPAPVRGTAWLRGAVIALASLTLAGLSAWQAALIYWRSQAPETVPAWLAGDPILQVVSAELSLSDHPERLAAAADAVRRNARAALVRDPLNAVAVHQLGRVAALNRSSDAGYAQFAAAEAVTRRYQANEIDLINAAARRGDLAGTLAHYDRLLRVYPSASETLYTPLAGALVEPQVRAGLANLAGSPWFADFFRQALGRGAAPQALASLLEAARARGVAGLDGLAEGLLGQLAGGGRYAEARQVLGALPAETRRAAGSMDFTPATTDPVWGPLAWSLAGDEQVDLQLLDPKGLEVRLGGDRLAHLARRVTLLPPGVYRFSAGLRYAASLPRVGLVWDVRCLGQGGAPLLHLAADPAAAPTSGEAAMAIPAECPAQEWQVSGQSETTQRDSAVRVVSVSLARSG